jgi:hypothetical protein
MRESICSIHANKKGRAVSYEIGNYRIYSMRFRCLFIAFCSLAVFTAAAQNRPQATANLSQTTMAPGDAATLTIEVSGINKIDPPESIAANGLDIRYNGYRQNTRITNNQVIQSISLMYTVQARNAGTFTIPSVGVRTDAGEIKTQPLTLTVQTATAGAKAPEGDGAMAFASIEVPKKTAYLGEAVPVEVRLYFDRRIRAQIEEMPVLEGDGFSKVKFPRPRQEMARKGGREFDVWTFRTTISPGKAGTVKLGPMEVSFLASIPRAKRNRPRSPFDLFDDSFFDDPFSAFGQMERRKVTAEAFDLEVKPLPTAGRPEGFSGAVGKFQMSVEGNPKRVKVGDPITLKMQISGTGNFDRVNAPKLVDPSGWHPYEPSDNFKANDELSTSGTKVFEMAVVPEEKKTQMPQVRFSYFDPGSEKYVTLNSEPAALAVEGAPLAAVPPRTAVTDEPTSEAPSPAPAAPPETAKDIAGLKYEMGTRRDSFAPLYRTRAFWLAQALPLLGFLVLLGVRFLRRDEATSRAALLRKERADLWRKLRSESDEAEFFQIAARLVQIQTALTDGRPAASVDAAAAESARELDVETAAGITEIFNARDERVFAGTARGDGRLGADLRARVFTTLERFEKCHAKN